MSRDYNPFCEQCKHYLGGFRCKAYPELVPERFYFSSPSEDVAHPHSAVERGQEGDFVFERKG